MSRDTAPFGVQVIPVRRLTEDDVRRTLERLPSVDGPIVTSALSTAEQKPFRANGFTDRESLHLLRHNFADNKVPRIVSEARPRSARRTDLSRILEIDAMSFDSFWAFDRNALSAARRATPHTRSIVASIDGALVGYAITGLAGSVSFLQRLAVSPTARGKHIGSHLVTDAFSWAIRRGASQMMVNTQVSNAKAFALYQRLGFEVDHERLQVLEWSR